MRRNVRVMFFETVYPIRQFITYVMLHNARYTPPTPTRRNCRVASRRRCEHTRRASAVVTRFTISCADN